MPIPDKADVRRFCEADEWATTNATSPDHDRYVKTLDDGRILRTKVSRGRGPIVRNPGLWKRMWHHQLGLESEQQFWDAIRDGRPVDRGGDETVAPATPGIEAWLFEFLLANTEMTEDDLLALEPDDAMRRYEKFISGS